jgi:hypothetical protein
MAISQSAAYGFLNGRFTRMFIDVSGSNTGTPTWALIGGELSGKWTIDPQLEDYTTKDSAAIVYYPTRYKWNGTFDTNYLDDDEGQTMVRLVAMTVGQSAPLASTWGMGGVGGTITAPGPTVRIGWSIQQDITDTRPYQQAYMVGLAALKIDFDMTDAKMGKMAVTFTGSGPIDISSYDPGQ